MRAPSRVVLTALLGTALLALLQPRATLADWTDFLPRTLDNGAYIEVQGLFEEDDNRYAERSFRWTDTFFKEKLTLFSNGYVLPSAFSAVSRRGHRPRVAGALRHLARAVGRVAAGRRPRVRLQPPPAAGACVQPASLCAALRTALHRARCQPREQRRHQRGRRLSLSQEAVLPARALQRRDADVGDAQLRRAAARPRRRVFQAVRGRRLLLGDGGLQSFAFRPQHRPRGHDARGAARKPPRLRALPAELEPELDPPRAGRSATEPLRKRPVHLARAFRRRAAARISAASSTFATRRTTAATPTPPRGRRASSPISPATFRRSSRISSSTA